MIPKVIELTDTTPMPAYTDMTSFSSAAEAMQKAIERGQPYIWKLPGQDTWLVAVAK